MKSDLYSSPPMLPEGIRIVLASGSPRRRELLAEMGYTFDVMPSDCDERLPADTPPKRAVELLAERKALSVAELLPPETLVIGSDTLVELAGHPLGKPQDENDALRMLMALSGQRHFVHTGVCVAYRGRTLTDSDSAGILFRPYTREEAWAYVCTGEPMDKAGAYGIQGLGGHLVEKREGEMDTVVGLPTRTLDRLLCRLFAEEKR